MFPHTFPKTTSFVNCMTASKCQTMQVVAVNFSVATQVAEELHGVACYLCNLSRNIFVARNVARSRTQFYFLQRLQRCNAPPATCLAMLCSISQSGSLLSSPRSSSVAVLRVAGSPIAQCNSPVRATAMLRFKALYLLFCPFQKPYLIWAW